ncbi:MAG: C-terminal binding protein [Chloroflexi bacterium]|nr:C-terminal binding protein [Chloroflexota bacterium]
MTFQVFQVDGNVVLEPFEEERAVLRAAGGDLVFGACTTQDEIVERAGTPDVLWLNWKPNIGRQVLEALPSVRLAVRWGVGFEQIDVDAATDLGVAVANAPGYGTDDVAEVAFALLLSVARRTAAHNARMVAGEWPISTPGSIHRLRGRTLGLIGTGRIGTAVAGIAAGFGMRVIGYDPGRTVQELAAAGIEGVDMDTLLAQSDCLSLHVPYMPSTHHLVNAALLAKLKPGAILVNTARGLVVDTNALIDALASSHLAGAGLDVYEQEPLPAGSPLRSAPNVVMTPHVGGYSVEAFLDLRREMCRTTIDFMTTGWAGTIVNPAVRDHLWAAV